MEGETQDKRSNILSKVIQIKCGSSKIWSQGFWLWGYPGGSDSKEVACSVGDPGLGLMDRGAWQVTVYGISKSQTRLSD